MENSHTLATESFSYSWLTDRNPCSISPDDDDELLRPTTTTNSAQDLHKNEQSFNFDVSIPTSSSHDVSLVHADEIFSEGHLMPVYYIPRSSNSVPPSPVMIPSCSSPERDPFSVRGGAKTGLGKWCSCKRILRKCFGFVRPFCKKTNGFSRRKSSRVDDLERKVCEVRSWGNNSLEASPRRSLGGDWSSDLVRRGDKVEFCKYGLKKVKSWSSGSSQLVCSSPGVMSPSRSVNSWCYAESPIDEAILYCKRSIEK